MPNLVVIVADTLRRLESVHQLDIERDAPFLSRLVKVSLSFDRAVASAPWTLPSHWSLLCGTDPWRAGTDGQFKSSERRSASLAKQWQQTGGVSFGVSHNPMIPARSGLLLDYDHRFSSSPFGVQRIGTELSSAMDLAMGVTVRKLAKPTSSQQTRRRSIGRGVSDVCLATLSKAARGLSDVLYHMSTSRVSFRQISTIMKRQVHSKPVHLFINLMDTHEPYTHAPSFRGTILESGGVPTTNLAIHSSCLNALGVDSVPFHAAYRHAISNLDRSLRALFELLAKAGILDDALVCLVSDHGQALGENGFFGHGWSLFDEVVRVPAYLWYSRPLRVKKGTSRILDWVDHRHLHEVLLDQVSEPEKPLQSSVQEAQDRYGPAISYFRGRRLSGFNPADRLPAYERIRVWQGDSQLEVYRGFDDPRGHLVSALGSHAAELESVADRVFHESKVLSDRDAGLAEDLKTSARLASWGYN